MKKLLSIFFLNLLAVALMAQGRINHSQWTELLQKNVDPYGKVNYQGFREDEKALDEYLKMLGENEPQGWWEVNEQKAFWINAYNAFTVKLILNNYPLESIKQIKEGDNNAWNIPFIKIGDKMYTLDYIEHTMLRAQFSDSRIHFAVNCTAISCPPLRNKAYSGKNLDIELRLATRTFINDKRFNAITESRVQVSQIFSWFKDDFLKEEESIQAYLNKNTPHIEVKKDATVSFMNYNWGLNEKKK